MPLTHCPFTVYAGIYRPTLQIRIINPHTGLSQRAYGLIDTGADECAVPAFYAILLGHNLQAGIPKTIYTGNGETVAFAHTTKFEIFNPFTGRLASSDEEFDEIHRPETLSRILDHFEFGGCVSPFQNLEAKDILPLLPIFLFFGWHERFYQLKRKTQCPFHHRQ